MSTFFGLNIARLGMQAQLKALEVTSHNIANANTPGFSRQTAHMIPTAGVSYAKKGMLGSGVIVDEIKRIRDSFLDRQVRHEMQTLGQWQARSSYLSQVEQVFLEPSESGLNSVISTFFDSWQELSLNPESSSARSALIENANFLLNSIKHTYNSLTTIRDDITVNIELKVSEINSLAWQISYLNEQTDRLSVGYDHRNDLMDRRDLLIEQLAKIINFSTIENPNGSISINIGGRALVHENFAYEIKTLPGAIVNGWPHSPQIVWAKDEQPLHIGNGELYGLIQVRDRNLYGYLQDFESLTWAIVDNVNKAHREGSDLNGNPGGDFFATTGGHILSIVINQEITSSPDKIAAAAATTPDNPLPGDGSNAVIIAQLRNMRFEINMEEPVRDRLKADTNGSTTLEFFYRDLIAGIGVNAQEANRMTENQQSMVELLTTRQLSVSGVSLDEEMANMVQFQLSYQAAARLVTTLDEIYNTLINEMLR